MKAGKLQLILASVLFGGWLGWLSYLAFSHAYPVVVSRSQLMVATLAMVVQVEVTEGKIQQVYALRQIGKTPQQDQPLNKQPLSIVGADLARLITNQPIQANQEYLFPLTKLNDQTYRLVSPPRSPGFDVPSRPVIYPWTPEVEKQVRELLP